MDSTKIAIIGLSVALFLVVQYVILDKGLQSNQLQLNEFYEVGYEHGLTDAINAIFQQTSDCSIATINFENITRNVLDAECVQFNSEQALP